MLLQLRLVVELLAAQVAAECPAEHRFSAPFEAIALDALPGDVGLGLATAEPLPVVAELLLPLRYCFRRKLTPQEETLLVRVVEVVPDVADLGTANRDELLSQAVFELRALFLFGQ